MSKMDKKQQIEEIANLMADTMHKNFGLKFKDFAEILYNAGYRKIPEDNIRETVEKPVDTSKREYESIDDIVRGFVVKDGKILYVTNILEGFRHEYNDIHEICDELNNDMKEIDKLMGLNNHLRFQLDELKAENDSLKSEKEGWKMRFNDSGNRNKKLSIKIANLKKQLKACEVQAVKEFIGIMISRSNIKFSRNENRVEEVFYTISRSNLNELEQNIQTRPPQSYMRVEELGE